MKIPEIKKAVELYSIEDLKIAEEHLYAEEPIQIEVGGADEGEKLTHIMAAIFIKEYMTSHSADFPNALRVYTSRVRNSIS